MECGTGREENNEEQMLGTQGEGETKRTRKDEIEKARHGKLTFLEHRQNFGSKRGSAMKRNNRVKAWE